MEDGIALLGGVEAASGVALTPAAKSALMDRSPGTRELKRQASAAMLLLRTSPATLAGIANNPEQQETLSGGLEWQMAVVALIGDCEAARKSAPDQLELDLALISSQLQTLVLMQAKYTHATLRKARTDAGLDEAEAAAPAASTCLIEEAMNA